MATYLDHRAEDAAALPGAFGYFNDFVRPDDVVTAGGVTHTAITGAAIAASGVNGGWCTITPTVTNDDYGGYATFLAAHALATGKTLSFKTRLQMTRAAGTFSDSSVFIGLTTLVAPLASGAETTTNAFGAVTLVNAVYFFKPEGVNTVSCCIVTTSIGTTKTALYTVPAAVLTLATTEIHTFGITINPKGAMLAAANSLAAVDWSIDGKTVFSVPSTEVPLASVILSPCLGTIQRSATGTAVLAFDYVGTHQLR